MGDLNTRYLRLEKEFRSMLLLGEILDRNRQAHPDKIAVTLADEALTFAQVDDAANRYANALTQVGACHQDVVVWWSEMSLRTVEGFMTLARLGAASPRRRYSNRRWWAAMTPALIRGTVTIDMEMCKVFDLCVPAFRPAVLRMNEGPQLNSLGFRFPQLIAGCTAC